MTKKEQLDPESNNQVEKTGDEALKVEETTKTQLDQLPPEEPIEENITDKKDEIILEPSLENQPEEILEESPEDSTEENIEELGIKDSDALLDVVEQDETISEVSEQDEAIVEQPLEGQLEIQETVSEEIQAEEPASEEIPDDLVEETLPEASEEVQDGPVIHDEAIEKEEESVDEEIESKTGEVEAKVDVDTDEVLEAETKQVVEADAEVEHKVEPEDVKIDPPSEEDETSAKEEESLETDQKDSRDEKSEDETALKKDEKAKVAEDDTSATEEDFTEKFAHLSREELVAFLEALVKNEDVNYIRRQIGFIKVAFHKLTRSEKEKLADQAIESGDEISEVDEAETVLVDPLKIRFDDAFKVYKGKKGDFDQAIEKQKHENLATKEAILEELRSLIESEEELKKTYDQFRDLQERWRNIGAVPQLAKNNLWNNYHFLIEKFFDKVKINKELKDLDLKKNLELKTELCEKAEELLLETSVVTSFQKLQKLHETWKETGPVPNDQKDEIWERFRAATVKLNQRRQEHYDGLRGEQDKNFAAKVVLCEKAEQLAELGADSPRKWQEQTREINELFKVWKTIGFAPKKVNNEIWNRFRTALNTFFRNKKEYLGKFKDIQTDNYNQKLNLCIQAEALKDSSDWGKATNEFISLQNHWKGIGPVPPKFSDKIWKRFRAACDEFFNRKSEYFSNIDQSQEENLNKKKELIEKVKGHPYSDDNAENLKVINDFQREWMEIGHIPIKLKDKVYSEFRKAIDDKFESLGISRKAKTAMSYRNKMDTIKNNPNADNIIYKERNFLITKISSLQNDINLWENNIGFFASSKKADVLKKEFEIKIEKAKQDIVIMEEKLKILREQ